MTTYTSERYRIAVARREHVSVANTIRNLRQIRRTRRTRRPLMDAPQLPDVKSGG